MLILISCLHLCEKLANKTNKPTNAPPQSTFPPITTNALASIWGLSRTNRDGINLWLHVTVLQPWTPQPWGVHCDFYNLGSGLQNFGLSENEREDSDREHMACRSRLGCSVLAKEFPYCTFTYLVFITVHILNQIIEILDPKKEKGVHI